MEALAQFLPFVVIAALFWFLLIRPAQRRQREAAATQRAASVGSEIMLTSGIFGTVVAADDETLQVQIAPGTVMKVARGAVARVITEDAAAMPDQSPAEPAEDSDGQ